MAAGASPSGGSVEEGTFEGEPSLTLAVGPLSATFLPGLGLTGVSLRSGDREHLALPGGLASLRSGRTAGLPLLAPWANRLGSWQYRAAGVDVDLTGQPLHVDGNGLPIHGFLIGRSGWRVDRRSSARGRAGFRAELAVDHPAFPFPHRLEVQVGLDEHELSVSTTLIPTSDRRVPVAFGWHPYLTLPDVPRAQWRLDLPVCTRVALDVRSLPDGETEPQAATAELIGQRTLDDLFRLDRDRRLAVVAPDGSSLAVTFGPGYPYAQVWVPPDRPFVALEPMTGAINSLGDGTAPLVAPGDRFEATFAITVEPPVRGRPET